MSENKQNNNGLCACAQAAMQRRTMLKGMAALGGVAVSGGVAFAQAPEDMRPQVGDFLVRTKGDPKALAPEDVGVGKKPIQAFAMSPDGVVRSSDFENGLLLVHYEPADLSDDAKKLSAEGVLAYSIICTHAGCEATNWIPEENTIECPCHGSHFDAKNNGAVLFGPASRKLPQLGLEVKDGKIVVAAEFDSRIGGDETM